MVLISDEFGLDWRLAWMNGWMDGWMDRLVDEHIGGWIDASMDRVSLATTGLVFVALLGSLSKNGQLSSRLL